MARMKVAGLEVHIEHCIWWREVGFGMDQAIESRCRIVTAGGASQSVSRIQDLQMMSFSFSRARGSHLHRPETSHLLRRI